MNEQINPEDLTGFSFSREVYDWIESGVSAILCMILIFTFIARTVSVSGESMEPTLQHKDRLVSSRLLYTPSSGDIVVVTKPNAQNEPLIKRVIATGGQTIDIDFKKGAIYVDGVELDEPYIYERTRKQYDLEFPLTVPEGHVFIMGDNRNRSWDSRDSAIGMIDERYILGRVIYRMAPYDSIGKP